VISNVVGRRTSGSWASRRVTLSRGAASHPQRRHHRAISLVSATRAGQNRTTALDPLPRDLQAEFVRRQNEPGQGA